MASTDLDTSTSRPLAPLWARVAAWVVALGTVPSALWRISVVFTGPECVPAAGSSPVAQPTPSWWENPYLVTLSLVQIAAGMLTLGLVSRWGEVVPRWVPVVGGRRIPVSAAVVPATIGAGLLFLVEAYWALNGVLHLREEPTTGCVFPTEGIKVTALKAAYAPLLLWPPLLAVLIVAYLRRRSRTPVPADASGR